MEEFVAAYELKKMQELWTEKHGVDWNDEFTNIFKEITELLTGDEDNEDIVHIALTSEFFDGLDVIYKDTLMMWMKTTLGDPNDAKYCTAMTLYRKKVLQLMDELYPIRGGTTLNDKICRIQMRTKFVFWTWPNPQYSCIFPLMSKTVWEDMLGVFQQFPLGIQEVRI